MILGVVLFAILLSTFSFVLSLWAVIEMRSMQKSTHQVQFIPAEDIPKKLDLKDKPKDPYTEAFDNIE